MDRRRAKKVAYSAAGWQMQALVNSEYLLDWEGDDRERVKQALLEIRDQCWRLGDPDVARNLGGRD